MKKLFIILFICIFVISCKLKFGNINSVLDISLDTSDEISRNIISPETTTVLLETSALSFIRSKSTFDIKVKGFDTSRLTTDDTKGKVKVFVRSVNGIKYSEAKTNSLLVESMGLGNLNPVDLDDVGIIPTSSFSISLSKPNTVSITANDSLLDILRKKIVFIGDVGVLSITLEFYDNNKEKLSYTVDLFTVVKRTS